MTKKPLIEVAGDVSDEFKEQFLKRLAYDVLKTLDDPHTKNARKRYERNLERRRAVAGKEPKHGKR